ncbi:MAG: Xaa-Pro aminopeptidase [Solirubrobacteraceae bacterium]|nr:Xaa-Pro aminopeptidase [Solirubrobacteraceae bacterium]
MSDDVVIYADTERSPTMRHEIPMVIGDPFLYVEAGGRRVVLTNVLERDRLARAVPDVELVLTDEVGRDELIAAGLPADEIALELCARLCERLGLRTAAVPPELPVALADRLRADGIELRADHALFEGRRRVKSGAELAGVRRAQRAAEEGMRAAAAILRAATADGGELRYEGETLTSERVRAAIRDGCARAGAPAPVDIMVVRSDTAAGGHDPGSGPLAPDVAITIDLWPRHEESGCWADMTRTFVVGEPNAATVEMHRLSMEALERATAALRPGVTGVELYDIACDVFEAAGHPTQRTKTPGEPLTEGFFFSLGHGVGLEVHEAPILGRSGREPLVAGDVLALEPGTSRGKDSARVEDLLLVTDDGAEVLTGYPYGLTP